MCPEFRPSAKAGQLCFDWLERSPAGITSRPNGSKLLFMAKPPKAFAEEVRQYTSRHAAGLTDREPHPAAMLHVSLLCLGEFAARPSGLVDRIHAAMKHFTTRPIAMSMHDSAIFGGGRSLAVRCETDRQEMNFLMETLWGTMRKNNLPSLAPGQFTPHMTVIYGCGRIGLMRLPRRYEWVMDELQLVFSHRGELRHECLGRWKLRPDIVAGIKPQQLELHI